MKILVPVDGSPSSLRAVALAATRARDNSPAGLFLLNVQPPVMSGNVTRFVTAEMIESYRREQGERALARARRLLDRARLPYAVSVIVGPVAGTIVAQVKARRCTEIIMGTRGMGSVAKFMLGSTADRVIRLSPVPVTLVK